MAKLPFRLITASLTSAGIATLVGVALSGPAAALYGDPQVRPLLAATSLVFVLGALGIVQSHLLMRALDFRALELRAMVSVVIGAVLAIVVAARGGGPPPARG